MEALILAATFVPIVVMGLLPIMNPLTTIPLFMTLTRNMTAEKKRSQARRTCIYAFCILAVFLLLGNVIIKVFGISLPGIRVAGGIIIMILGLRMIFSGFDTSSTVDAEPADIKQAKLDFSFSPLAMPSLSGPGSIAIVMGYSSEIPEGWTLIGNMVVVTGIAITAGIAYLGLASAAVIERVLGDHGMQAITKIMGFLLTCIGVQFIASGLRDFIVDFAW